MGRPKKWKDDAQRMRSKRTGQGCSDTHVNEQNKRTELQPQNKRTVNWQDIDPTLFPSNGVSVNGYVRVIRKVRATLDHDYGVVTETDFCDRYKNFTCTHNLEGWACKVCL
jgi:hypothetical protein